MNLPARIWADLRDPRTRPRATLALTVAGAIVVAVGKAMVSALWQVAVAGH